MGGHSGLLKSISQSSEQPGELDDAVSSFLKLFRHMRRFVFVLCLLLRYVIESSITEQPLFDLVGDRVISRALSALLFLFVLVFVSMGMCTLHQRVAAWAIVSVPPQASHFLRLQRFFLLCSPIQMI